MFDIFEVNGYTVVLAPHNKSNVVSAKIFVNAGAADEDDDSHGSAHYLEHMFFKGTTKRSYKEMNLITSELGSINASTSRTVTSFDFDFLLSDVEVALGLLCELCFNPLMSQDEFDKEKSVILEECQTYLDDGPSHLYTLAEENLSGTKYGHSIIGTPQNITDTTLEKVNRFRRYYNPANMIVSVCGNVTKETLIALLSKMLPNIEPVPNKRQMPEFNFNNFEVKHHANQAAFLISMPGLKQSHEIESNYVGQTLLSALGSGMHSLLFDRLREELGLCYSVHGYHSSSEDFGSSSIFCMLDEKNIELAVGEVKQILKTVCNEGINPRLLEITKKHYLFNLADKLQTTASISRVPSKLFDLGGFPLNEYISFEDRKSRLDKLTNNNIIEFANYALNDENSFKLSVLRHQGEAEVLA